MRIKKSLGTRIGDFLIYAFLILLTLSIIAPFWDILCESLTDGWVTGFARLWPSKITFINYEEVLGNRSIWSGYRETIIRTVLGTSLNMIFTIIGAYCLSKKRFPMRKLWTLMIVIPMFFSGGLIPSYLWNVQLGLRNTRWVLILPGLISSYNLIVMRNFFSGVPTELEESAYIDGANNLQILVRIYLPVSTAVLATVSLWNMVGHWNSWFDASIYITDSRLQPLQIVLRRIINAGQEALEEMGGSSNTKTGRLDNLKSATLFVVMLPIMCVYPFLQKYFMKGTLVGSIKG